MKQFLTIMAALMLMLPSSAFALSFAEPQVNAGEFQIQTLLQEDLSNLVALNGEGAVRAYLLQLLIFLSDFQNQNNGVVVDGNNGLVYTVTNGGDDNDNDADPDVETDSARDIQDDRAQLRGEVDMNDFRNGIVFFVYGEDEDAVEDATREDEYRDIDEDGDDLQKVLLDSDLDSEAEYRRTVRSLDDDTRHYFALCVEYENDNDREVLECGDIEDFRTDDRNASSNDEEPDVRTLSARDIQDDSAELRGEVDMNDFRNGIVFFVYGEDEDDVEDVIREDSYNDIDEDGDDLQKVRVDTDLDDEEDYELEVRNLDDNTRHYFRICVEYEDEDDDETLECGDVEEFRTDN